MQQKQNQVQARPEGDNSIVHALGVLNDVSHILGDIARNGAALFEKLTGTAAPPPPECSSVAPGTLGLLYDSADHLRNRARYLTELSHRIHIELFGELQANEHVHEASPAPGAVIPTHRHR